MKEGNVRMLSVLKEIVDCDEVNTEVKEDAMELMGVIFEKELSRYEMQEKIEKVAS